MNIDTGTPRQQAVLTASRELFAAARVGAWLADKAQQQATTAGIQQAARNLRKQGMPVELALLVLTGRVQ